MNAVLDEVEKEALRLSEADRAKLAFELLESLDSPSSNENLRDTVRRRADELAAGEVQAIPGEEVFRKGRALLK